MDLQESTLTTKGYGGEEGELEWIGVAFCGVGAGRGLKAEAVEGKGKGREKLEEKVGRIYKERRWETWRCHWQTAPSSLTCYYLKVQYGEIPKPSSITHDGLLEGHRAGQGPC